MLFSTKSSSLLILLALIFTTIAHAAPAAGGGTDVDQDEEMISVCLSIPECLKSLEEEKEKLDQRNVAALNKAKRIQAYKPIFRQIGSLTELYNNWDGKEVRGVREWIQWQKDVDNELNGDVEMIEPEGKTDTEMLDSDDYDEDVPMDG